MTRMDFLTFVVGSHEGEPIYRCGYCGHADFADGMAGEGGYCCRTQDVLRAQWEDQLQRERMANEMPEAEVSNGVFPVEAELSQLRTEEPSCACADSPGGDPLTAPGSCGSCQGYNR